MKIKFIKFIILLLLISSGVIKAQNTSFTLSTKHARNQGPSSNFMLEAKANFSNISTDPTDTEFEWEVIELNIPGGWEFGMCDPNNCLTNLSLYSKGTFSLETGKQGEFKGDFVPNSIGGTGTALITITSKKFPANKDSLRYTVNAWTTGVKNAFKTVDFYVYPNPAKDKISLKYQTREQIQIEIYNILGSKVKTIKHQGMESEISVADLNNGVYFIRFNDGNKTFSKQITVAH
jgi:hypothetical protein